MLQAREYENPYKSEMHNYMKTFEILANDMVANYHYDPKAFEKAYTDFLCEHKVCKKCHRLILHPYCAILILFVFFKLNINLCKCFICKYIPVNKKKFVKSLDF